MNTGSAIFLIFLLLFATLAGSGYLVAQYEQQVEDVKQLQQEHNELEDVNQTLQSQFYLTRDHLSEVLDENAELQSAYEQALQTLDSERVLKQIAMQELVQAEERVVQLETALQQQNEIQSSSCRPVLSEQKINDQLNLLYKLYIVLYPALTWMVVACVRYGRSHKLLTDYLNLARKIKNDFTRIL